MSCFLAFSGSPINIDTYLPTMRDFLPYKSTNEKIYLDSNRSSGIILFHNNFLTDKHEKYQGNHYIIEGFPEEDPKSTASLTQLRGILGGFSYTSIVPTGLMAYRSWSGEHLIYYRKIDDILWISNRISLLLSLRDAELNEEVLVELATNGYLLGERSLFKGIYKLLPGEIILYNKCSKNIKIDRPTLSYLFDPLSFQDTIDLIDRSIVKKRHFFEKIDKDIILPLSGGKDSRCIAALFTSIKNKEKAYQSFTRGQLYHPDVLAAKEVADCLGIKNHIIRRPSTLQAHQNFASIIINALVSTEGNLSLYDKSILLL